MRRRTFLRCEINDKGDEVLIVLAKPYMIKLASDFAHEQRLYMDATHGQQKYEMTLITVLVKDLESHGAVSHELRAHHSCSN
jgi:hypothetical protein